MPDDPRDKYTPKHPTPPTGTSTHRKTPIGGVTVKRSNRQPISRPEVPESWEDGDSYTPVGDHKPTPPAGLVVPRTISESDMLDVVARRAGETKNLAIDTKMVALHTNDRVEQLRKETSTRIDKIDTKVDGVIEIVGNMREEVGKQGGQNTLIISMLEDLQESRDRTEHVITTTRLAEVEVDKSRMLTDVEIAKKRADTQLDEYRADKALRRKITETLFFKILAAVGVVWAAISAYYLAK